jgi:hypothetical protein
MKDAIRKADERDALIMKLRTLANMRGASNVAIQLNVNALEGLQDNPTLRERYLPEPDFAETNTDGHCLLAVKAIAAAVKQRA